MPVTPEANLLISIVIPAYNEAARLPRTLDATVSYFARRRQRCEILVVDDGSTDATAKIARSWAEGRRDVQVLSYGANQGKGYAVRYGILRAAGDSVLFMDADLATPIEEIEKLEAALDSGAAIAIGSRPLRQSKLLVHQPWYREWAGRGFNKVVQLLATPGIYDTQCGFKLFTRDAAQAIFSRCELSGFSFDVEALFLARRLGLPIEEVPVRWAHQEGSAAFSSRTAFLKFGLRMVRDIARIRWIHRSVRKAATASLPNQA